MHLVASTKCMGSVKSRTLVAEYGFIMPLALVITACLVINLHIHTDLLSLLCTHT